MKIADRVHEEINHDLVIYSQVIRSRDIVSGLSCNLYCDFPNTAFL